MLYALRSSLSVTSEPRHPGRTQYLRHEGRQHLLVCGKMCLVSARWWGCDPTFDLQQAYRVDGWQVLGKVLESSWKSLPYRPWSSLRRFAWTCAMNACGAVRRCGP